MSEIKKKQWREPSFVEKMLSSFSIRPTKLEIQFKEFLARILPDEYRYVGDGQLILGRKIPDFLNINGKKKLIELYGNYWHRNDDPQERIDYFKKYGFDTLITYEHELKDQQTLAERIISFTFNSQTSWRCGR